LWLQEEILAHVDIQWY